jgi:hypothetical protein
MLNLYPMIRAGLGSGATTVRRAPVATAIA